MSGFYIEEGPLKNLPVEELNKSTGAVVTFKGIVRSDSINKKYVVSIEFTTQKEIAQAACDELIEKALTKFLLNNVEIHHSLGTVLAGHICFFVSVESKHRKEAFKAIPYIVDEFKSKVPIFGKEILNDNTYEWKTNN